MNTYNTPEGKDPQMWQLARKRAGFKRHLAVYLVVNIFLWVTWYFTREFENGGSSIPWPAWSSFGWGIGLMFHFLEAYVSTNNSVDKEYDKLIEKHQKQ